MDKCYWLDVLFNPYLWYILVPVSLILFYKQYVAPLAFFRNRGIPGPTPIPILGTLFANGGGYLFSTEMQPEQINRFSKIFGLFFGSIPLYVIADTQLLKEIMVKDFAYFPNRIFIPTGLTQDEGILVLRDGQWKHVRNVLTPTFSSFKMKQMFSLLNDSTNILIDKLDKVAKLDEHIDIWRCFGRYSMEIILACAFGVKSDIQSDDSTEMIEKAHNLFKVHPITLLLIFLFPSKAHYWSWLDRPYYNSSIYFDKLARNVIENRKENNLAQSTSNKDFLQLMLDAGANDEKQKLTDRQIVAQAMTFLLAGYDTTSNCMAFTAYLLAIHPDIQDKLIAEINSICEDQEKITYEDINQMEYLDMVISESLRLYPPGSVLLRETKQECTINGYYFPKNMLILIPVYGIHHCADYWSDPEKFDPERFSKKAKENREPFIYLPFGYGPRNCVGMRFALMEAKLGLASILRNYRFVKGEKTEIPLQTQTGVTLSPKNGIYLRLASHNYN